jgi:hypothetical protein
MSSSQTTIATEKASRYLQQLCKHFAHKIPVSFTPHEGECQFVCGTARLDANDTALHIKIESPDDAQRAQTQQVIESHLLRFAFREELGPLNWSVAN